MNFRVAIYVQHLLGAGHLVRAISLAEALGQSGHRVILISGGFPVDREPMGYQYFQLPPTRAISGDFTNLVDDHGLEIDDRWRRQRAKALLKAVSEFDPDLVITETYPFGRRQFRFELEPLLKWVSERHSVSLMASIRDVLQRRKESRNRDTVEIIRQYYDAVLVHADDTLFTLDASFPLAGQIWDKLVYTGYIHQSTVGPSEKNTARGKDGYEEVVVSGGSGTVSAGLIDAAIQARSLSSANTRVWRLLTGRDQSYTASYPEPGIIVEPNRSDFYTLLSRCAVSVSQAGYNTTLDVLASGARAVMIPFAGDGETEQSDRAQALERAGRLVQVAEAELTPLRLAQAVDRALEMKLSTIEVDLNGAVNSARLITQKLGARRT